jgi:valyl-tRNA synthetase
MLGLYITGKIPFKTVYLHGLVLDAKAQKMSKSRGNVINPLDLTEKFGTDAFRMGLIVGNTPGTSLALSDNKVTAYKKFVNKLWNVTRFVIENRDIPSKSEEGSQKSVVGSQANTTDSQLLTPNSQLQNSEATYTETLSSLITEITAEMEDFKFYIVAEKIYHYVWHEFADKIIEESKPILNGHDEMARTNRQKYLIESLLRILKILHPFMPFVTEEIWQTICDRLGYDMKNNANLLMVQKWPLSTGQID